MALLIRREYFKTTTELLAEAATRVGPGASYYALTMGGRPIGYSASTIDTTVEGVSVQNNTVFDVQALGTVQRTGIIQTYNLTRTLRLRDFDAVLTGDQARFRATGRVDGDSVLEMTVEAGGAPQRQRIRLDRPLVMSELVNLQLAIGGELQVGRSFTIRSFDPLTMQQRAVSLTVMAESTFIVPDSAVIDSATMRWVPATYDTLRAFQVRQSMAGVEFDAWIDQMGNIVLASSPIGIEVQRTAFEIAVQNYRSDRARGATGAAGANSDLINRTAIQANETLDPENLSELKVRIANVQLAGFALSGGRQRLAGDTLIITREWDPVTPPEPNRQSTAGFYERLPIVGTGDTLIARALEAEPLIQKDDPRIQAMMRQIVGRERRAGVVARLINEWVYEHLEKAITVSVPSAAQVLEMRRGDCNEHTVLYTALARAAGLPTRMAAGVVYLRGRFYYHAWPEVWLGQWVAVDPTFGQFPADAAHLRFVIGGLAQQVELVRLIGRLQLDVVR